MKLLSVLAAFLILCQSLHISSGDLARVDEFLEHAAYHKKQYGDSLMVFISKHYGDQKAEHQKKHQEEQDEHEKLPFQHQSCTHHASNAFILISYGPHKIKIESDTEEGGNFYYLQSDYSGIRSGIFQPPRFA